MATTPRSGSNFLCQALASTGSLGHPLEYFNPEGRRGLEAPDYPDATIDQVRWILDRGATPNGVYGFKVFPGQFSAALQRLDLFAHLPNLNFIRLERRDLLGQAISKVRAKQTLQFRATQPPSAAAHYDADRVAKAMLEIACDNSSWDIYFARTGLQAPTVYYEDVERDPGVAIQAIAAHVGVTNAVSVDVAKIDLTRQRDDIADEWRTRFIAEHGAPSYLQILRA